MGIYIDTPGPSKREWLAENGDELFNTAQLQAERMNRDKRVIFWQRAPWGENAAIAYDRAELDRLYASAVFEAVYAVPVEKLREIGVGKHTLDAWR